MTILALEYIEIDVPSFVETSPPSTETYRFAPMNIDYLPANIDAIASIERIDYVPGRISLGTNLGQRGVLTIKFRDHRHILGSESFDSGTFFGKWRARYKTRLRNRPVRWFLGSVGQSFAEFQRYDFIIDDVDGPTPDGVYTIKAKDILKQLDGDRAQAPVLSNGFLTAAITDSDTSITLSPSGIGDLEYPTSGFVAIGGEEICAFTRVGDVLTLETTDSPPASGRGQLGTVAASHEAGDRAQLVLRYFGQDPADIIRDLMVTYAGVDPAFIPLSEWLVETQSFLQRLYTATIPEPVSVNKLITELVEQSALAVWWDALQKRIRLQVLRAINTDAFTWDEDNVIRDSLSIADQPKTRVSQVWTYFGQRNSLIPLDEENNYRSVQVTGDFASEVEFGSAAIKKIFSRWIPFGGRAVAQRLNDILIARYVDPPRRVGFRTFATQPNQPLLGTGYRLKSWSLQNSDGTPDNVPIQITRMKPGNDIVTVEGEESLFNAEPLDLTNRVLVIDSAAFNVNMRTLHDGIYPEPTGTESPAISVTCYIEENVIVGSTDTAVAAFDVGSWPGGIVPTLVVRGRIQGKGGDGATPSVVFGVDGDPGGDALLVATSLNLTLDEGSGEIWSGGGGGATPDDVQGGGTSGAGGGAGTLPGAGGAGIQGSPNGEPGTSEAGGQPGPTGRRLGLPGGDPGEPGGSTNVNGGNASGGAAGNAIDGVSFVTKTGVGDIRGPEIN